jgi:hypothetical protein
MFFEKYTIFISFCINDIQKIQRVAHIFKKTPCTLLFFKKSLYICTVLLTQVILFHSRF